MHVLRKHQRLQLIDVSCGRKKKHRNGKNQVMVTMDDKRIEGWTKTVALAAVFVYVCGYLVITIRNANFGFSAGDVVKPRMLATGTTFLMLCIIPTYFAHKILPSEQSQTPAAFAKLWLSLLAYVIEIITLVFVHSLLVHADPMTKTPPHFHLRDLLEIAVTMAVLGATFYLVFRGIRHVEKHPKLIIVSCFACFAAIWWNQISNISKGDPASNTWLLAAGLIGCWLYRRITRGELSIGHMTLLIVIVLIGATFYADLVFPHIYQRWGGGQPVPVGISLFDKSANKESSFNKAQLIDQDSDGIFVQYGDEDVAVFVPKDSIARICYLERAQPHDLSGVLMPSLLSYEHNNSPNMTGCSP
jgi:hypothetical protein